MGSGSRAPFGISLPWARSSNKAKHPDPEHPNVTPTATDQPHDPETDPSRTTGYNVHTDGTDPPPPPAVQTFEHEGPHDGNAVAAGPKARADKSSIQELVGKGKDQATKTLGKVFTLAAMVGDKVKQRLKDRGKKGSKDGGQ